MRPLSIALLVSSCGGTPPPAAPPPHSTWSYSDVAAWGGSCQSGKAQSPIDLATTATDDSSIAKLAPMYAPGPLLVENNGHTIQVTNSAPSSLEVGGVKYTLTQFHFHAPSEHTVAGKSFDAEVHLVHESGDGKLLVLGRFLSAGHENAQLKPMFDAMPMKPEKASTQDTIDVASLLPQKPEWQHYPGSLTTPPCSEGVSWFVALGEPIQISDAQLAKLKQAVHAPNNRPTQPLNGRSLTMIR